MPTLELEKLLAKMRTHRFDPSVDPGTVRSRLDRFATYYAPLPEVTIDDIFLAGTPAERLRAGGGPILLYFHGGGYVAGSPASHRHLAARLAVDLNGTVIVPHYRLAPENPFPAALDDCCGCFAELSNGDLFLAGDSAGGGLALAVAHWARTHGVPPPRALWLASPWVNLEANNASYDHLARADPSLSREIADWHAAHYLGDASRRDPRASPLFGDLGGAPPSLIQIGDREVFFGDAVELHQRLIAAGSASRLSVGHEMFHVWHLHWPELAEARAAIREAADFLLAAAGE